ncbi:right-handed parallel beta-helix repeat-containing protein [bacterium]|nr:right-handed parallel beta-helix repeat-containing protein [bacterium]
MKFLLIFFFAASLQLKGDIVKVRNREELKDAVLSAKPGTVILLASGVYEGDLYFENVRGKAGKPIVIGGEDPSNPPIIRGGGECLHFSKSEYLELRDLILEKATGNGLNIDDGGVYDRPAHHIVLKNLKVRDIGPKGNRDGIKLSGVDDFRIERCVIERWGDEGQGIDMVGCHKGIIYNCVLRYEDDKGFGIQAKGGSSQIIVRNCLFQHAGARAMQIGGSTGKQFFRPPLKEGEPHCEAKDITVEGCIFIGSLGAVAFATIDGATVQFNTFYRPKRWVIRILQESMDGFLPCRNGVFRNNLVVFRSDEWFEGGVNIGPNTEPKSFRFIDNWWFCLDSPSLKPNLPSPEIGGVYGVDPMLKDPERGNFDVKKESPARNVGAHSYRRRK